MPNIYVYIMTAFSWAVSSTDIIISMNNGVLISSMYYISSVCTHV